MGSNQKQTQMERKAYFEGQLKDRMSLLSGKGIESPKINKDTIIKKLRANIKAVNARLRAIAGQEGKTEALAKAKAEKAAAPQKTQEETKDKKAKGAKEVKEAPVEGKEKKKKKTPSESKA